MKKSAIAFSALLALPLMAAAQPPAWFVLKHPEVAAMEKAQTKEAKTRPAPSRIRPRAPKPSH